MSEENFLPQEIGKQVHKDAVRFLKNECDYGDECFYEGVEGTDYGNHKGEAKLGRRVMYGREKPGEQLAHMVTCRKTDSIPKKFVHGNWASIPLGE